MLSYQQCHWKVVAFLSLMMCFCVPIDKSFARSPVKLRGSGQLTPLTNGTFQLKLAGTASHLGLYQGCGEVQLSAGPVAGTMVGEGIVVLRAANGDQLVGVVVVQLNANGTGSMSFSWKDKITFRDGTVLTNTGRFLRFRPPGAFTLFRFQTTFGIIAILIGL